MSDGLGPAKATCFELSVNRGMGERSRQQECSAAGSQPFWLRTWPECQGSLLKRAFRFPRLCECVCAAFLCVRAPMSVLCDHAPLACLELPRHVGVDASADATTLSLWSGWGGVAPLGAADVLHRPEMARACGSTAYASLCGAKPQPRCLERAGDFFHDEVAADTTWASGYLNTGAAAGVEAMDTGGRGVRAEHAAQGSGVPVREIVVPPQLSIRQISEGVMKSRAGTHQEKVDPRTTIALRRLPPCASDVQGVCRFLDELGLACTYDVVQILSSQRSSDRGSVLVNFLSPAHAEACARLCSESAAVGGRRLCAVYAEVQGAAFVATCMAMHFRKSLDPICLRGNVFAGT